MAKKKDKKKDDCNYRCNCGFGVKTTDQLVKHYREFHPDDAFKLFDQISSVGDKFADKAIAKYYGLYVSLLNQNNQLKSVLAVKDKQIADVMKDIKAYANRCNQAKNALESIATTVKILFEDVNIEYKPNPEVQKE